MAGYAANFSQNSSRFNALPSIFHVLAQENISSVIEPSIRHILKVLAEKKPESFQKYYQYSEELCAAIHLVLEYYFLKKYSSSFSEYFYSLKRVSNLTKFGKSSGKLSQELYRSLFVLVILPYLKRKLDSRYQDKVDALYKGDRRVSRSKLNRAFLGIYPYVHAFYEGSILLFQLAYAAGMSKYHSPLLYLSGTILKHHQPEKHKLIQVNPSWKELFRSGCNSQNMKLLVSKMLSSLESFLSSAFTLVLFFIQFLHWWHQSDASHHSLSDLPNLSYPKGILSPSLNPIVLSLCPLCRNKRTNDTVISSSGFVFCYPCILEYVKDHSRCPVTGYPCEVNHLVKLYMTD